MSAGKGSAPRNCFSEEFRSNYDRIFAAKKRPSHDPDQDIHDEIERILDEEPPSSERHHKLSRLSMAKAGRLLARRGKRTVPPHP